MLHRTAKALLRDDVAWVIQLYRTLSRIMALLQVAATPYNANILLYWPVHKNLRQTGNMSSENTAITTFSDVFLVLDSNSHTAFTAAATVESSVLAPRTLHRAPILTND